MTKTSSNAYLFFGEDSFSLRKKIDLWKQEFAKKFSAEAICQLEASEVGDFDRINWLKQNFSPSLFSTKKLIIVKDGLPAKATQAELADFLLEAIPTISKDFFVVFWQTQKPDGRLSFTKKFNALVTVNEFQLPHGTGLNSWLASMALSMGAKLTPAGAETLAIYLGRDLFEEKKAGGRVIERKEAYDLWQAFSELQKLSSFSLEIGQKEVASLVRAKIPDSVFALSDQIVARNQKGAFSALENYLSASTADEKTNFIKIIGLLSEQIRSLYVVSLLAREKLGQDQIAEKLGWSTGRVFITLKNAQKVSLEKLKKLLEKLLLIDVKIKTSDPNLSLLLDGFIIDAVK